ncbi:hypothetical protein QBC39DRAFT_351105 [Podospora conica]|nr:hypothetical protein QBC39DRAFT_351105 [Schizothecium conicum]
MSDSEIVYNSHGISIDRFESKWTGNNGQISFTRLSIRIKAGQTTIAEVVKTQNTRDVLLSGKWEVRQSLNAAPATTSTITTDAPPPPYSSSAQPARGNAATIRVFDYTGVTRGGVSVIEKRISIASSQSQTPSSFKLILILGMPTDLDAGLVGPKPGCPVLHPGFIPALVVDGSWNIRQRYRTNTLPVRPTTAPLDSWCCGLLLLLLLLGLFLGYRCCPTS